MYVYMYIKMYIEVWVLYGDLSVWFLKTHVTVCAQKPLVYAFILSVARPLPWTPHLLRSTILSPERDDRDIPRVKRQKKRLKYYMVSKLGVLWNYFHWWNRCWKDTDLKWFWWLRMWCRCIASGPDRVSSDFWRGCREASVTVHGGHLAHNLNYVECQSESFHLFKTWTSIFFFP